MYVLYLRDLAYRIPYTMRVPVHTVWMSVHTVWVYVVPCFHVLSPVRGVFSCCFFFLFCLVVVCLSQIIQRVPSVHLTQVCQGRYPVSALVISCCSLLVILHY